MSSVDFFCVKEVTDDDRQYFAQQQQLLLDSEEIVALQDLFVEGCSSLYHDILDCVGTVELESNVGDGDMSARTSDFINRQAQMQAEGGKLIDCLPQLSDVVISRLKSVNNAMEQLQMRRSLMHHVDSTGARPSHSSALSDIRNWLQTIEQRLITVERVDLDRVSDKYARRLVADQQLVQLEIETDGRALVQAVERQLNSRPWSSDGVGHQHHHLSLFDRTSSKEGCGTATNNCSTAVVNDRLDERRQRTVRSLTQRWHGLWLRSLQLQCKIDARIERFLQSPRTVDDSDPELCEPAAKRRRLLMLITTTIIDNSETTALEGADEIMMDNNGNNGAAAGEDSSSSDVEYRNEKGQIVHNRSAMVGSSDAIAHLKNATASSTGPWEVITQDVGYSSGENSIHEALNDSPTHHNFVVNDQIVDTNEQLVYCEHDDDDDEQCQLDNDGTMVHQVDDTIIGVQHDNDNNSRHHPVIHFYKTVPLDDAGATDTETPRTICHVTVNSRIPFSIDDHDMPFDCSSYIDNENLTDSLIVETGTLVDTTSNNDIQDVLSLFDDDKSIIDIRSAHFKSLLNTFNDRRQQQQQQQQQGTKWCEFRSGQLINGPSQRHINVSIDNQKNSCDASSEDESDTDQRNVSIVVTPTVTNVDDFHHHQHDADDDDDTIMNRSMTLSQSNENSLKRRYRQHHRYERPMSLSSNPLRHLSNLATLSADTSMCASELETSVYSTCSNMTAVDTPMSRSLCLPPGSRGHNRRKLRVRRMPRSMSDGEHLCLKAICGKSMLKYTFPLAMTTTGGVKSTTGIVDDAGIVTDDVTGPEQSDAPVYEWDDYNPPAHNEDGDIGGVEQRLDDKQLTAFGDDYRQHISATISSRETSDTEVIAVHSNVVSPSKPASVKRSKCKLAPTRQLSTTGSIVQSIRYWWPLRLCMILLTVIAGVLWMLPTDHESANNWRRAWGPKLDYVRGPPPC